MADDPQDQKTTTGDEIIEEELPEFIKEDIRRSTHLAELTPHWKQKLGKTIISLILPVTNLALALKDYPTPPPPKPDDPQLREIKSEEHNTRDSSPYSDGPKIYSEKVEITNADSIDDAFNYELARHFYPDKNIESVEWLKKNPELLDEIERKKESNPEFYKEVERKYSSVVVKLNQEKGIIAQDGKFVNSGGIDTVKIAPFMPSVFIGNGFRVIMEPPKAIK